mmetsp:Transcript_3922/g.7918  ORF Transcript_3922/g.7918 Transcript_3922/m.7918 type:complete len:122 (+) Transcript_3922:256-621(+)
MSSSFRLALKWFIGEKTPASIAQLLKPSVILSSEVGPRVYVTPKQFIGLTILSCGICVGGGYALLSVIERGRGAPVPEQSSFEQERLNKMLTDAKDKNWRENLDMAANGMGEFMKPPRGGP